MIERGICNALVNCTRSAHVSSVLVHRTHVTTLEHELGNDSVEAGAGVAEALLLGAEGSEVAAVLGTTESYSLKTIRPAGAPGSSARVCSMAGIADRAHC